MKSKITISLFILSAIIAFVVLMAQVYPPSWATAPVSQMSSYNIEEELTLTHNVWTWVTNDDHDFFIDKKYLGLPVDGDSMMVEWEGSYLGIVAVGLKGLVVNSEYDVALFINDTLAIPYSSTKIESTGDVQTLPLPAIYGLNKGDILKLKIRSTVNDDNVVIRYAHIVVKYVGAINKTVFPN